MAGGAGAVATIWPRAHLQLPFQMQLLRVTTKKSDDSWCVGK
jgi:hypothetical protein